MGLDFMEFMLTLGIPVLAIGVGGAIELTKVNQTRKKEKKAERRAQSGVLKILNAKDLRSADFDSIVGHEAVKKKFRAWARRIQEDGGSQKYMLLSGPPGTGKSLMARAFAASISKDTRLVEVKCEALMKDPQGLVILEEKLKKLQKKNKPIVLFMDELSSVGNRKTGNTQQINHLLRIMDGISGFKGKVAIVGTTNHPEMLDSAFRNRFQQILPVDAPSTEDRVKLLESYLKRFNLVADESVDLTKVAEKAEGLTGRKIEHAIEILQESLEDDRIEALLDVPKKDHARIKAEPMTFNQQQILQAINDATDWVQSDYSKKSDFELIA